MESMYPSLVSCSASLECFANAFSSHSTLLARVIPMKHLLYFLLTSFTVSLLIVSLLVSPLCLSLVWFHRVTYTAVHTTKRNKQGQIRVAIGTAAQYNIYINPVISQTNKGNSFSPYPHYASRTAHRRKRSAMPSQEKGLSAGHSNPKNGENNRGSHPSSNSNNVRRTLVLYPTEPPQFHGSNERPYRIPGGNAVEAPSGAHGKRQQEEASNGAPITDSAQAIYALRKQALMFNSSGGGGLASVYTSGASGTANAVESPNTTNPSLPQGSTSQSTAVARRQPVTRSVSYSLGRLSNHHYVSSIHAGAENNPFVSVTPQGPIAAAPGPVGSSGSGGDVLLLAHESDHNDESASSLSSPQLEANEGTPPRPMASRGRQAGEASGDGKQPVRLGGNRMMDCVPGSVLSTMEDADRGTKRVASTGGARPPNQSPPHSAPVAEEESERPTTAGFHAAYHAAPYDRVGNRRGLLELLKLRSDVAAMRAKQKVAPIYRELKPRGSSMPMMGLTPSAAWSPETVGKSTGAGATMPKAIQPTKAQSPTDRLKNAGGPLVEAGVVLGAEDYANLNPSRPTSASASRGNEWDSMLAEYPPIKAQPVSSNVLPAQHQSVIQQQADRRAAAAPLHERSEGELQDELAQQSCDAVGLTPVLAGSMPKGRYVVINMLTTWGDNHEVGLCGVEFYNDRGDRIIPMNAALSGLRKASGFPGIDTDSADHELGPQNLLPQEASIDKNVMSISAAAADGSLRVLVEYSATPEELNLWASSSSGSAEGGFPSGFGGAALQQQLSAARQGSSLTSPADSRNSVLQRIQKDPRRQVASVVDGVVNTHDESHMLAIPYSPGHHHLLCFVFPHPVTLSMIRIFNYCGRGRVQTFKGVRIAEITMDDDVIFRGEIQRHSGEVQMAEDGEDAMGWQNCENILFTEDEAILCRIVASSKPAELEEDLSTAEGPLFVAARAGAPGSHSATTSPLTTTRIIVRHSKYTEDDIMGTEQPMLWRGSAAGPGDGGDKQRLDSVMSSTAPPGSIHTTLHTRETENEITFTTSGSAGSSGGKVRRFTNPSIGGARGGSSPSIRIDGDAAADPSLPPLQTRPRQAKVVVYPARCPKRIRSICFMFLATWGDPRTIGLSGLRFRNATGNLITQAVSAWRVQYPDGSHSDPEDVVAFTEQVGYLFDENSHTACTIPFHPAVQLVIVFEEPIPSLGFLEVANYSVGEKTFCGVKEVRLFLAEGDPAEDGMGTITQAQREIDRYRLLWTYATSPESRNLLKQGRVFEVTPSSGVSLRKAPAYLSVPRFQTYDLSLQGGAAGEPEVDAWGDVVDMKSDTSIGIGPGTGGMFGEDNADQRGPLGGGNLAGGYFATSFANSLNASMNIRAAMAMKRARMMLQERPEWLLEYQPYVTPLLPVGYVCKVRLHICARNVGVPPSPDDDEEEAARKRSTFKSAAESLKAYMREWILKPFRSCSFVNENGELIRPINNNNPGQPLGPHNDEDNSRCNTSHCGHGILSSETSGQQQQGEAEEGFCIPMVVESVLSTIPRNPNTPYQDNVPLQVFVDLVYVADMPFCLAVLCLNRSLVMDGSAAWVKHIQVSVDDAVVFDSDDAVIKLDTNAPRSRGSTNPNEPFPFPKCVTSLKPYILFTLDSNNPNGKKPFVSHPFVSRCTIVYFIIYLFFMLLWGYPQDNNAVSVRPEDMNRDSRMLHKKRCTTATFLFFFLPFRSSIFGVYFVDFHYYVSFCLFDYMSRFSENRSALRSCMLTTQTNLLTLKKNKLTKQELLRFLLQNPAALPISILGSGCAWMRVSLCVSTLYYFGSSFLLNLTFPTPVEERAERAVPTYLPSPTLSSRSGQEEARSINSSLSGAHVFVHFSFPPSLLLLIFVSLCISSFAYCTAERLTFVVVLVTNPSTLLKNKVLLNTDDNACSSISLHPYSGVSSVRFPRGTHSPTALYPKRVDCEAETIPISNINQHLPNTSGPAAGRRGAGAPRPSKGTLPNVPLHKGDFIAVLSKLGDDGKPRWILGQVNSQPFEGDADIRFWEKQRDMSSDVSSDTNPQIASLMDHIFRVQGELSESMDKAVDLSDQMRAKRQAILSEIRNAEEYVKESKHIMDAARDDVEKIPDKYWQELKSYRVAPKMVAAVLRAVMLLLCEDEARTWPQMQKILRDINFKSRVTSYNAEERLSPERREFIMRECVSRKSFRFDRAMQGSQAMGPIYYWVLAQLDCGEAFVQKHKVDREKMARQRELRALLRQVNAQAQHISEHLAFMDDLDDEVRACYHRAANSAAPSPTNRSRDGVVTARYKRSFAGSEHKMYLKPAYYDWKPTDRVLTIMRNTVLCNFGPLADEDAQGIEGGLNDRMVHTLDDAISRRLHHNANENDADRQLRESVEERRLERNILRSAEEEGITDHCDSLSRRFTGDHWQAILERRRQDVIDIFAEESSICLRIPKDQVTVCDLTATQPILVSFDVRHSGRRDVEEMQEAVNEYEYPRLRNLYAKEAENLVEEDEVAADDEDEVDSTPPFDGHVFGLPAALFTGSSWEECLHAKRPEIAAAFAADTAAALSVPKAENVVVNTMKAGPDGIEFFYEVYQCPHRSTETLRRVTDHSYPRLWDLYSRFNESQRAERIGRYEKTFQGPDWRRVVQNRRLDLEDHFLRDESECLRVMPNQIQLRSVRADEDGLTVRYDVAATVKISADEVNKTASYPYPNMWALYEDADSMITSHEIGFEGDGWEEVLRNKYDELQHRFVRCTSDLLGLKDDDVLCLRFSTGSLFANFDLRHPSSMSEFAINEKLSQCPFLPVWELLPLPEEEQEEEPTVENSSVNTVRPTSHELGFIGEAWEKVLEAHEPRVRLAILGDTCSALPRLDPNDITVSSLSYADESLIALVTVQHGGSQEEIQQALEECPFAKVWRLLHDLTEVAEEPVEVVAPVDVYSKEMERVFPGDDWDLVLEQPEKLRAAFCEDVAEAIGVDPANVEILSTRLGSLIVAYRVKNPNMSDDELRERLHQEYTFPRVQSLYRARSASRGMGRDVPPPTDGVRFGAVKEFTGNEWANLVENHYPAVERAAMRDISAARDTPETNIVLHELRAFPASEPNGPGLRLVYDVPPRSGQETEEEFQREAESYPFPLVQALHRSIPRNMHTDKYTVHFDADGWAAIVRSHRWELARALADDTGEACSISPDEVVDVEFHVERDALTADMCICHANSIPRSQIEESLFLSPFRRVWEMYEQNPQSSLMNREFRGEGWEIVNSLKPEDLRRAFANDTAKALHLPSSNVEVQEVGTNHGGCCVTYVVRSCPLTTEEVSQKSAAYLYPEVWALYELYGRVSRPQNFNANKVFGGDRWRSVLSTRRQAVSHAFQLDAANALHLSTDDIAVPSVEANEAALTVHYRVKATADTDVPQRLETYNYPLLWEEYNREESISLSDVDRREVTPTLQRRFYGDRWGSVLQNRRGDVHEAFAKGVADAAGVPMENVEVLDARLGSLIVDYRVHHPACEDDDIIDAVQRHGFPELMALHPPEDRSPNCPPPPPPPPAVKEYETTFAGENWGQVVRSRFEELRQAFLDDTATCLNCNPALLRNVDFAFATQLVAYFGLPEVFGDGRMRPADVQQALLSYSYPRVWALYPKPPVPRAFTVVTTHAIHFSGGVWSVVCQIVSDRLREAVYGDVAECLQLPMSSMSGFRYDVSSKEMLDTYVCVEHPSTLTNDEIKERMSSFHYPRVWSLYDVSRESRIMCQRFEGNQWKDIMRKNRRGVSLAFQNDMSHITHLPASYCRLHAVEADKDGLEVAYGVLGTWYSDEQIASLSSSYDYPQVWSYYNTPEDNLHKCKLTFPGHHWDGFFKSMDFRRDVEQAFYRDISACFPSLDVVHLESMHTTAKDGGNLTIDFSSTASQEQYVESRRRVNGYDFPAIWSLYRAGLDRTDSRQPNSLSESVQNITTRHELTFEGPDWDYVWTREQKRATDIFEHEVARALDISRVNVSHTHMTPANGGMILRVSVLHAPGISLRQLGAKLETYPYNELWALYEPRPRAAPVGIATEINFEGPDWDFAVSRNGNDINRAIFDDTIQALNIRPADVRDLRTNTNKSGLHARMVIMNSSRAAVDNLQGYSYPRVWGLYMIPERAIRGVRRFDGNWEPSTRASGFQNALQQAFSIDVAEAIGVDPHKEVEFLRSNLDEAGNLVVAYNIHRLGLNENQVNQTLKQHGFRRVWELYLTPIKASGDLHRRFPGDRWGPVLQNRRDDIDRYFALGVSNATGVPAQNVEILDAREGSLLVDYRVHNPPCSDDQIHESVQRHGFPELVGLHPRTPPVSRAPPPPTVSTSNLSMHFDGSGWTDVVAKKRQQLLNAFQDDTAQALQVRANDVAVNSLSGCLTVLFSVHHPSYRNSEDLQQEVNRFPYERVWALYQQPGPITTLHEANFTGDNWFAVEQRKHDQLLEALASDSSEACGVGYENACVTSLNHQQNQMKATLLITHSNERDAQSIHRILNAEPFRRVWALYEQKPVSLVSRTPSVTSVGGPGAVMLFPGEKWEDVVQEHRSAVRSAFIQDTSDEAQCPVRSVQVQSLFTSPSGVSINYDVQNGRSFAENARVLNGGAYPHVWALYDKYANRRASLPPPMPPPVRSDRYTAWREKRFDGADWDIPFRNSRRELENAFRLDAADAVGVPQDAVEMREKVSLGSLVVNYRIRNPPMSEPEVHQAIDQDPFHRLWGMYNARPFPMPAPQYRAPTTDPTPRFSRDSSYVQQPLRRTSQLYPPATKDPEMTGRRSYRSAQPREMTDEERRAARELEEAEARAERRRRERDEAQRRAEQSSRERRLAEEEAERQKELARQRDAAAAEEAARKAREVEEEERRVREAREAAQRARRGRPSGPIDAEEEENEEDQLTYLRRALAEARQDRDHYQSLVQSSRRR
eukprot:gene3951-2814_t